MFSRSIHVVVQCFIPFHCQIIFHCVMFYILLNHTSFDGQLICLYFLVIKNNAAMNIHEQVFMQIYVFNSLGYISRSEDAGHLCLSL